MTDDRTGNFKSTLIRMRRPSTLIKKGGGYRYTIVFWGVSFASRGWLSDTPRSFSWSRFTFCVHQVHRQHLYCNAAARRRWWTTWVGSDDGMARGTSENQRWSSASIPKHSGNEGKKETWSIGGQSFVESELSLQNNTACASLETSNWIYRSAEGEECRVTQRYSNIPSRETTDDTHARAKHDNERGEEEAESGAATQNRKPSPPPNATHARLQQQQQQCERLILTQFTTFFCKLMMFLTTVVWRRLAILRTTIIIIPHLLSLYLGASTSSSLSLISSFSSRYSNVHPNWCLYFGILFITPQPPSVALFFGASPFNTLSIPIQVQTRGRYTKFYFLFGCLFFPSSSPPLHATTALPPHSKLKGRAATTTTMNIRMGCQLKKGKGEARSPQL